MLKFNLPQQLEEVMREIALREKVYPRMVSGGQMKESVAQYHLARMRAVADTLRILIAQSWHAL
jgi:hypothetical protein